MVIEVIISMNYSHNLISINYQVVMANMSIYYHYKTIIINYLVILVNQSTNNVYI